MEFRYNYKIKASDIWQVRMYYAYASYLAVVNLTCIAASVVLIVTQWNTANALFRTIMLIFLSLFLVIQPLLIYISVTIQAGKSRDELELIFNDGGFSIRVGEKKEKHFWKDVIRVTVRPTLIIVYTGENQGYILTNRVLKDTRKDFLEFVEEKRKEIISGRK